MFSAYILKVGLAGCFPNYVQVLLKSLLKNMKTLYILIKNSLQTQNSQDFDNLRTFDAKFWRQDSYTFSADFFRLKGKICRPFLLLECMVFCFYESSHEIKQDLKL